jgi:hypothetical protein
MDGHHQKPGKGTEEFYPETQRKLDLAGMNSLIIWNLELSLNGEY